ncbi:uncharacterized protein [Pseudorasbora parva]|uniref:uncharacterized protein n=1 Tax=Pseudorasbora parva TaxID=51549 RepID=UPI00351E414F
MGSERSSMEKPLYEIHHLYHMSDEMQHDALQVAFMAVDLCTEEKDIANYIVKEFDRKHRRYWHCLIGSSDWSSNWNCSIIFSIGDRKITLFRTDW